MGYHDDTYHLYAMYEAMLAEAGLALWVQLLLQG